MHFGKTVDAEFAKIDAGVAPFPYNKMKRSLKSLLSCKSAEAVQGKFIGDLSNAVRRCDSAWVAACRRTLQTTQPRRFRSIMRSKQHSDSIEMAQRLDAWAELAQEGVRKMRQRWTAEEEDCLRKGMAEFNPPGKEGPTDWISILDKYDTVMIDRTSMDLKDKWRNMKKKMDKERADRIAAALADAGEEASS